MEIITLNSEDCFLSLRHGDEIYIYIFLNIFTIIKYMVIREKHL